MTLELLGCMDYFNSRPRKEVDFLGGKLSTICPFSTRPRKEVDSSCE